MNVYISADIEGVAGIVSWDQVMPGSNDYEIGRRLMIGEVNAAIAGAFDGGAAQVVMNDSHSRMSNLVPDLIDSRARLVSGHFKPMYMLEGLDDSFDAGFFIGYHGAIGTAEAVLGHSYSPRTIWEAKVDGRVVGEIGLNALVCEYFGVPVCLVTGDQTIEAEAAQAVPDAIAVKVKHSYSRYAAESLSPQTAREMIRQKATEALQSLRSAESVRREVAIELTFLLPEMAELASWINGVHRLDSRRVQFVSPDGLTAFRTFHTILLLTRSIIE